MKYSNPVHVGYQLLHYSNFFLCLLLKTKQSHQVRLLWAAFKRDVACTWRTAGAKVKLCKCLSYSAGNYILCRNLNVKFPSPPHSQNSDNSPFPMTLLHFPTDVTVLSFRYNKSHMGMPQSKAKRAVTQDFRWHSATLTSKQSPQERCLLKCTVCVSSAKTNEPKQRGEQRESSDAPKAIGYKVRSVKKSSNTSKSLGQYINYVFHKQ